jgi:hypothetical protein
LTDGFSFSCYAAWSWSRRRVLACRRMRAQCRDVPYAVGERAVARGGGWLTGYPPQRGTAMRLDDAQIILYARGGVYFFRTYLGLCVPNPLVLHARRRDTPDWNLLLKETLALTKMN